MVPFLAWCQLGHFSLSPDHQSYFVIVNKRFNGHCFNIKCYPERCQPPPTFVIFSMTLKYLCQKATGSKFYRLRKAKNCTQKLKALRPNLLNNHSSELWDMHKALYNLLCFSSLSSYFFTFYIFDIFWNLRYAFWEVGMFKYILVI